MISSENPFIKTDIGILTDINLEDAISQYLQNSQINLFSDSSRGGILFSIKYINVNEESPFYQYVFGNSCASRERQSVKELFIKFVLFSRNKNGRNISFQYEIPNTLTIRKVKLHETLQDEIQREFVVHNDIFGKNYQHNVEKWVNAPCPIMLKWYTNQENKTNMIALMKEKGDAQVNVLLNTINRQYIQTSQYDFALYFMEKINAIPLANVDVLEFYTLSQNKSIYHNAPPIKNKLIPTQNNVLPTKKKLIPTYNDTKHYTQFLNKNNTGLFNKTIKKINNLMITLRSNIKKVPQKKNAQIPQINNTSLMQTKAAPKKLFTLDTLLIKFFELNSLKMLNDKQRTQMERNKKVQYRFNRLFIYELFKLFDDGNGYVHNDIHYGNVLYDENNSNPVVYLIDFGRSKSCQEYEKLYEQLQIQPSLFHRNAKEYLTQYFKYLLPQITKYGQENNGEKIKVSVIKMLLLNYIGLEIISTHNRRIFDTEYVANASYQWFFYFYVKPLLIVNKSKITINFNNKKTNQLVEFIKQRLELDRKISLNFYCNNSQQPDIIPINKTTRKSLGGYKIKSVKRNHLSTIQR